MLVGPRRLDPAEEQLIRATDVTIAAPARGFPGTDLPQSIARLAGRCDLLYLHIDADILDRSYVPNHRTAEPGGPDMAQAQAAVDTVLATGKFAALTLVSAYGAGRGGAVSVDSGIALLRSGLASWRCYGLPGEAPETPFQFLDPGPPVDGVLELVLKETRPAEPERGYVPVYRFAMVAAGRDEVIGQPRPSPPTPKSSFRCLTHFLLCVILCAEKGAHRTARAPMSSRARLCGPIRQRQRCKAGDLWMWRFDPDR